MVDMLINSDKTVPEIGSVADKTPSDNNDPNKFNDIVDVISTGTFSCDTIHGLLFEMKLFMLMKMLF